MTQRTLFPAIVIGLLFAIVLTFVDLRFLTGDPVATFLVNAVALLAALTLYGFLMQKAAAAGVVEHPGRKAADRGGDGRGTRGGRSGRGEGSRSDAGKGRGRSGGGNRGGKSEKNEKKDQEEEAPSGPREQGTIKWFSGTKGFGFIIREDGSEVFVHHRALRGQGRRDLPDGQAVSFVVVQREKGPQADQVELEGDSAGNRA
jgi:cold shock CspA family protein